MKYHILLLQVFLTGMLCTSSFQTHGQHYKAVSMSLADGLSQSSVYDIIQDDNGFIWMATQDGLNKYDGTTFNVYRDEPFDTNSISSNNTAVLLKDSKGRIWAGTANNGLNLFQPSSEGFLHFHAGNGQKQFSSNIITSLYEDINGTMWIGTGKGLYRVNETVVGKKSTFAFEKIALQTNPGDTIDHKFISIITGDRNKQLWVGTYAGLFKLSINRTNNTNPVVVWYSKKNNRLSDFVIQAIAVDKTGDVWVGTRSGIDIISYPGENIRSVKRNSVNQQNMVADHIKSLLCGTNGDMWIGYNDHGVQVVRESSILKAPESPLKFEEVKTETPLGVLSKGAAISFWEDRITRGIIWCGFNTGGAVRLIPVTKNFSTNRMVSAPLNTSFVSALVKTDDDRVWLGTNKGLLCFNKRDNSYQTVLPTSITKDGLDGDYISGLVKDESNKLYFGSSNKIFQSEVKNDKILTKEVKIESDTELNFIRTLSAGTDGAIYAIRRYSILKLDPVSGIFKPLITQDEPSRIKDQGFYYSCHYIDYYGNQWVGTSSGLELYEMNGREQPDFDKPQTFYHHQSDSTSLRNQNILCITEDSDHNIWVGTMNGLTRIVNENGKRRFVNYSTRNGLKNNVIYAILNDSLTGHLWISTNNGLTEFATRGFAIATYDIHDGLQSNEFNSYAAFKATDGELYFGGIDGYTSFYPRQIIRDQSPPSVLITSIQLNGNQLVKLDDYQESKMIDLKYKDNSFTVNFIGLHYVDPQKNQYAYKLEGFQSDWTYAGNSTRVNFSQLPPGKYIFRVKASNSDGSYNTEGDMFIINVKPPFYKTIWFYLMIAAFIAGVLWGLHKYRLSMKLDQVREVEKIRRATAADFHDELGHKLTIISWFAEILKKKIGPEQADLRPHLDRIIEASGTLYHTMKDMLWAMDPDKDSVYDLYSQIREFGLELFDNTGVLFEAGDVSEDLKEQIISPAHKRHVLLIFKEVMHNSLKHANSTTTNLELVREEQLVRFRFKDNGTGFKMNGHNTGHGLNNVKRRANMINARIDIHSEGDGTVAELDLLNDNLKTAV
ncbi:MAG: hypothetical protein IPG39_23255 [Bacteroidetes bacterium]|nr:hypothetical protein [Bacteroidota bacterium]